MDSDSNFFDYKGYEISDLANDLWESVIAMQTKPEKNPNPTILSDSGSSTSTPNERFDITVVGLKNLGSTCFMNSVLQCMIHTVPFFEGILSETLSLICYCGQEEFCLRCSLQRLFRSYLLEQDPISPSELANNLPYFSESFSTGKQDDAHDFLTQFLIKLQQQGSLASNVFGGSIHSKSTCIACKMSSENTEDFWGFHMPIKQSDNLISAILSHTVGKVDYTCENCRKNEGAIHKMLLAEVPSVAIIQLKRYGMKDEKDFKIEEHVPFPLVLDLLPFTLACNNEVEYELYAIIVQNGQTLNAGHYYSFIRVSPDAWFKFNDEKVSSVTAEEVLSQKAYILFYARKGVAPFSDTMQIQRTLLFPPVYPPPKQSNDGDDSSSAKDADCGKES